MVVKVALISSVANSMVFGLRLSGPLTIYIRTLFFHWILFVFRWVVAPVLDFGRIFGLEILLCPLVSTDCSFQNKTKIAWLWIVFPMDNGPGTGLVALLGFEILHSLIICLPKSVFLTLELMRTMYLVSSE